MVFKGLAQKFAGVEGLSRNLLPVQVMGRESAGGTMFGSVESPLVERLVEGENQIEVCTRAEADKKREDLIRQIGYDLVHVKFPNTRGGTEIGIRLQRELCGDLEVPAEESDEPATVKLVGDLTLDWIPIRVTALVSLQDYTGTATVEKRDTENDAQ